MSDKEYLRQRFEQTYMLGKEMGEMLAEPPIGLNGARKAVEQAEENIRQAVAAFQAKEKELMKWAVEGWYHACGVLDEFSGAHWLHSHGVPEDIINGVIEKIKAFRDKCQSRSEKP